MKSVCSVLYICLFSWIFRLVASSEKFTPFSFNKYELQQYKNEVHELFNFAFENYLQYGYPYDEVKPISCAPKLRNFKNSEDLNTNDVLGNFSTTLIDSLTTIAVLGDRKMFLGAVKKVEQVIPLDFKIDATIQVFETTIRILGGLISAHLYAIDPTKKVFLGDSYDGHLLKRAKALGDRLLPAFFTRSGLPVPRINLAKRFSDIKYDWVKENNAAASACPMVEFSMLSFLTGDDKYRIFGLHAFYKTWELRSDLDLLPMSFNPETMEIYYPMTGTGASIDSFYEYALKGSILFDSTDLYRIWSEAYYALSAHAEDDWFFYNVYVETGEIMAPWIDSLGAFFPGVQVLDGEVLDASQKHLIYLKLWNTYGGIPERWIFDSSFKTAQYKIAEDTIQLEWYPLRPEFIESTYYLYRATQDVFYLNIGWHILQAFKKTFKQKCGFAGFQNIITGEIQDRMESFVLGETLKYLYLLFDENNELHTQKSTNLIFNTEAHPMWLTAEMKLNYTKQKHINNDIYLAHLKHLGNLWKEDAQNLSLSFQTRFMHLFTSIINSTHWEDVSNTQNSTHSQLLYYPDVSYGTCRYKKISLLPYTHQSEMLNNFQRLFDIDYLYSTSLIRPTRQLNLTPMEINQQFYERWYNPITAKCLPMF